MTKLSGFDEAVVIDVETTGVNPKTDRIISLAMIRAKFSDLKANQSKLESETVDVLVHPGRSIPKDSSRVHGIKDKDVADLGPFADVAKQVREFIGDCPVIAHNVSFDKKFLNAEFKRAGVRPLSNNKTFCTMRRFQSHIGRKPGSKLEDAARVFGVEGRSTNIHEAGEDARMALQVAAIFYIQDNHLGGPDDADFEDNDYEFKYRSKSKYNNLLIFIIIVAFLFWLLN